MFNQAFFEDIQAVVTDLFQGSDKIYVERSKAYDETNDTFSDRSPSGSAVEAVITSVSKDLVDGEKILKTDTSILIPGQSIPFEPSPGDILRMGEEATSEPAFTILAVRPIRSLTTFIVFELVARI